MNLEMLQEIANSQQEKKLEVQALTAKIKGVNSYLSSLLQKKIRIDLEIRRTKKQLSKLKKRSSTIVKTSVSLESATSGSLVSRLQSLSEGAVLSEADLTDFNRTLQESENLLQEVDSLEGFKETSD